MDLFSLKGRVRHGTRHSLKVLPKYYRSQFDSCRPVEITTLDFSPSGEPIFLVSTDLHVLLFLQIVFYALLYYILSKFLSNKITSFTCFDMISFL